GLANGTRYSYVYDGAGQVLRLANLKPDNTTMSSFNYGYDRAGNRTRVVEADGTRVTWTYDNTYQLKREQRSGANSYDVTYVYDPAGNRTLKQEGTARTTSTFDAGNQLVTEADATGPTTYTFDANGNQTGKRTPTGARTTITWDYENRMTKVVLPGGLRNTMQYDGDGRRVRKDDSTGTAKFLWDGQNILLE